MSKKPKLDNESMEIDTEDGDGGKMLVVEMMMMMKKMKKIVPMAMKKTMRIQNKI